MKKAVTALLILLLTGATLTAAAAGLPRPEACLRLHVLASGDSEREQELKRLVRDAVNERLAPIARSAASRAELLEALDLDELTALAESVLRAAGCGDPVRVSLERTEFPDRNYEGVLFPAGTYDALRVVIGEGKGQNWWCVLFPPLCFGRRDLPVRSWLKEVFGW